MLKVMNDQQRLVCKNLLGFPLTDPMALFAFSSVALVPLKGNYLGEDNDRWYTTVKVQGTQVEFNPAT